MYTPVHNDILIYETFDIGLLVLNCYSYFGFEVVVNNNG